MDVFKFNPTNLDPLTETYDLNFYFTYLAQWPHLFKVAEGVDGTIDAYSTSPTLPLKNPSSLSPNPLTKPQ